MNFPFRDPVHSISKTGAAIPDTRMDIDSVPEIGSTPPPEDTMDVDVLTGDLQVGSAMKESDGAAEKPGDDSAAEQRVTQIDDDNEPPIEVEE